MLHAFGVKNYYNLNMEDPAVFQNGVSFVYGICGSGKTNLCRALGDIIEISPDGRGQKSPRFYYHFSRQGFDFIYEYDRDCRGRVGHASVLIPQLEFSFKCTERLHRPMDIFRMCRTPERRTIAYRVIGMFEEYLLREFRIIIPECKTALQENLYRDAPEKKELDLESVIVKEPESMTLIIDDFEYNGMLSPLLFIDNILSCRHQAIVTVRKSEWIDRIYGNLGHYYFMKNGNLIPASYCLKKEIRSVDQLKTLFIKGSFDV